MSILRFVWHGAGQNEEFTIQHTYHLDATLTPTGVSTIVAALAPALTGTPKTTLLQMMAPSFQIDQVSGYYYDTDPRAPASIVSHQPVTGFASTGTGTSPFQTSMCVSTLSDFSGASNRGRMYLPAAGLGLLNNQFTTTQTTNGCALVKALLETGSTVIKTNSALTAAPAVIFSPTKGTTQLITKVSADTLVDIQRRRAESLTPLGRSTATVTTS